MNDLIELEPSVDVFLEADGAVRVMERVWEMVENFSYDAETTVGRKSARSFSRKIGSLKRRFDEIGKDTVSVIESEAKEILERSKMVKQRRKALFDALEKLQKRVTLAADEFDEREYQRKHALEERIEAIIRIASTAHDLSEEQLQEGAQWLDGLVSAQWDEFDALAEEAISQAMASVRAAKGALENARALKEAEREAEEARLEIAKAERDLERFRADAVAKENERLKTEKEEARLRENARVEAIEEGDLAVAVADDKMDTVMVLSSLAGIDEELAELIVDYIQLGRIPRLRYE